MRVLRASGLRRVKSARRGSGDLPDNEAAAAAALAVDAAGGATTTTTVLLTPEQVDDAARRSIDAVDYRPPGT